MRSVCCRLGWPWRGRDCARDQAAVAGPGYPVGATRMRQQAPASRFDIGSVATAESKALPCIGEAEAKKIVAGRPYLTKADLVTKNVFAEGIYVALKDRIVALQAGAPAGKK